MAKNLIPEVCKMLGVEVYEEFKIVIEVSESPSNYYIDKNGVLCEAPQREVHESAHGLELADLLSGYAEIVKLPWKPKEGEYCYTFGAKNLLNFTWVITMINYQSTPGQMAMLAKGWIFHSREEAEAALPKVAEELGVEYEI